ncbi:multiheme c-type cytochrome [Schlesneria sp. T3-172]|uniref:multiheme c-type cytochrome n=1 Tax=Schlesneria sphaerica TaxID=3373610 RepID=UPI0037C72786
MRVSLFDWPWIAVAVTLFAGCGSPSSNGPAQSPELTISSPSIPKPSPRELDYAGSATCATCHREIADQFAQHPMGRSSGSLSTVPEIEAYGETAKFITADDKQYRVEKDATGIVHHEELIDRDEETLYDFAVAMELAIGSGRHGRSYAYRRGDRYFMSPISWYTAKSRWDLSPGYLPGMHQRFDRLLTERCLACHIGQMNIEASPDSWNREAPIVEHAISCERCHGPGASHVAHHQQPDNFKGEDRIVNPGDLDPERRDAVCHQCHFHAARTSLRYGRRASDFRPGDRLSDIYVILSSPPGERTAVSQSEQMLTSTCYQKSHGKMGCISCHNPHALPSGNPSTAFDQKCAACHSENQPQCSEAVAERIGKSCVGCHMPRFDASDIPHTAFTDHRILRRPQEKLDQESPDRLAEVLMSGVPEWEIRRAEAMSVRTDRKQVRKPAELERAIATLQELTDMLPEDPEIWESLAWFHSRLGKWSDVEKFATRALELAPGRVDARELLTGALSARSAWNEVDREVEILLQKDKRKGLYYKLRAEAAWHQGDLERGLELAEESLQCEPTQMELRRRLSVAYEQLGNQDNAERHRKILTAISRFLK